MSFLDPQVEGQPLRAHYAALAEAVSANQKAVELALKLYAEGHTIFLNVLNAQLALYTTQEALAQSRLSLTTNVIALYKALGGGWSEVNPTGSPPAADRAPVPNAAPAPGAE